MLNMQKNPKRFALTLLGLTLTIACFSLGILQGFAAQITHLMFMFCVVFGLLGAAALAIGITLLMAPLYLLLTLLSPAGILIVFIFVIFYVARFAREFRHS